MTFKGFTTGQPNFNEYLDLKRKKNLKLKNKLGPGGWVNLGRVWVRWGEDG